MADVHLVHVNDRYTRGEEIDWDALFCREDVSEHHDPLFTGECLNASPACIWCCVRLRHQTLDLAVIAFSHMTANSGTLHRQKAKDWVFRIPRLSTADFDELESFGVVSMRDVPKNFPLNPKQQRVVDAAKSGTVWRSPELAKLLPLLAPPPAISDFETFQPSNPDLCQVPDHTNGFHFNGLGITMTAVGFLIHADFLANGDTDPRREFSETLIDNGRAVSRRDHGVVTISETRSSGTWPSLFPDLAERLTALLYRIVDLLPIVADNVAHPDFQGSYSMKAVAPAIAPEITYDDLDIADGGDASGAFYRIVADPTLSPEVRAGLRCSLLHTAKRHPGIGASSPLAGPGNLIWHKLRDGTRREF